MELSYVLAIVDRNKRSKLEKICKSLGLTTAFTMMGRGTATQEHLSMRGLSPTEKAVITTVAVKDKAKSLMKQSKEKLCIDIPGNGIMVTIPIKSVGGAQALAYLAGDEQQNNGNPEMKFEYELIYVIVNEGHSDEVMDAARPAGAMGGTVISAKGTGMHGGAKFKGLSLMNEREVILIVAKSVVKADIMRAIMEKAGVDTPAGAVCFSLPVTHVAGVRRMDED